MILYLGYSVLTDFESGSLGLSKHVSAHFLSANEPNSKSVNKCNLSKKSVVVPFRILEIFRDLEFLQDFVDSLYDFDNTT